QKCAVLILMKIFILRHFDAPLDIIGGWSDISLTNNGFRQADEVSEFFLENKDNLKIEHIISSDLKRAKQSIEPIAEKLNLNVEYNQKWRPINWGDLNGMSAIEAKNKYPTKSSLIFLEKNETFPNGESPQGFYNRLYEAWLELISKAYKGNVLLCTHNINMYVLTQKLLHKVWFWQKVNPAYKPGIILYVDTESKKFATI
ncbi:MAG: histidine phosphatase family protein, partial [Alphaproteobacteria bacterium]|nr:histidine phosphatase family protein [Alphaproteobacteria bacterium]